MTEQPEPWDVPYGSLAPDAVHDSSIIATVYGGRHSTSQQQREADDQVLPGAGSFGLLALAVVATMMGLGVEFNALPTPHAVDAKWIPIACVPVALLAGYAGVCLRFRQAVDTGIGLAACTIWAVGSAVGAARVNSAYGIEGVAFGVLVMGLTALERAFSTPAGRKTLSGT